MNQQPFNFGQMEQGVLLAILGVACVVLLVLLVIVIFYLLTLQKALSQCAPRNRLMEPGMVWLSLIPCFNIIWGFFIAIRVPDSLRNEYRDRGIDDGGDYGKSIALTNAILGIGNSVLSQTGNVVAQNAPEAGLGISIVSLIVSAVSLALFVIFWVKIYGYSKRLEQDPGRRDWDDRRFDDDDDDDYPGTPRGPREGSPDTFKEGDAGRYK